VTEKRTIDNLKIIAGIFRECIVSRTDVMIDSRYKAKIVHIAENNRRSKNDKKNVFIVIDHASDLPKICSLEIFFNNCKITTSISILRFENQEIEVSMPDTLLVHNLREDKRIEPRHSRLPSTTVLLINDYIHEEVPFKLINVSKHGLAGEIEIDRQLEILPGARIVGRIIAHDGVIDVSGQVVAKQGSWESGDTKSEIIRLLRNFCITDRSRSTDIDTTQERRKEPRFQTRFDVTMHCILMPIQTIDLEIEGVSVTGFSAVCKTPLMQPFLLPGIPLRMKESSLVAQVLYHSDGLIRCQWIAGNDTDRGEWLKKIAPSIAETIALTVPEAGQLFEIFCESGAFSSDFLRSERSRFDSSLAGIESESRSSSYIHRWIDRKSKTESLGQISSIRMGDNAWFATDLVKRADERFAFSDRFVEKFLHSFGYYAISTRPTPRIFLIWVKNHPYWRSFQEKISKHEPPDAIQLAIGYQRLPKIIASRHDQPVVRISEVSGDNYIEIENIHRSIGDKSVLELVKAFDFEIDRFGSPRLSHAVWRDNKVFWRKYLRVESESISGLAILTALPDGMNPNRVIDSGWFFPFDNCWSMDNLMWTEICMNLKRHAAENGLKMSAIRRVMSLGKFTSLPDEHAEMTGFLVHPKLLLNFGQDG
jgi:hypothetical protein